jgi:DNA-binding response OmpR family regulator
MRLSLLIAHSDAALGDFFRLFCAECGFDVEAASGGLDCLSKLRTGKSHVLIMEQSLLWGGSDGVLARLREEREHVAVPVILICDESAEIPANLLAPPVAYYLRKPYRLTALLHCVRAAAAISDRIPGQFRNDFNGRTYESVASKWNKVAQHTQEVEPCLS